MCTVTKQAEGSSGDLSPPSYFTLTTTVAETGACYVIVTSTSTVDAADGGIQYIQDNGPGLTFVKIKDTWGDGDTAIAETEEIWAAYAPAGFASGTQVRIFGYSRGLSDHATLYTVKGDGTTRLKGTDPAALLDVFQINTGWHSDHSNTDTGGGGVTPTQAATLQFGIHGSAWSSVASWTPIVLSPVWTVDTKLYNGTNNRCHVSQHREATTAATVSSGATSSGGQTWQSLFVALKLEADTAPPATQKISPVADISRGSWLAEPGDGTTNLFAQIDETTLSATDYIQSSASPTSADIYKFRFAPARVPAKPRSDSTFHFRVDHLRDGGDSMQMTPKLYAADGTTLIKAWSAITVDAETTTDLTLTGSEADTIPDADFAVGLVMTLEAIKV